MVTAAQRSLQYTRLTVEDGLSNNSVQCLLQDKRGFMWIGTSGGLNRYDGSSFIQYSILSQPALSNNIITALLQDEKGQIWIGTENGLNILDPSSNTIRQFIHTDTTIAPIPRGPVRLIQKMKNGDTWILSDKWLVQFDGNNFLPVLLDSALLQTDMVLTGFKEHSAGEIWLWYLDQVSVLAKRTGDKKQERITGPVIQTPDYAKIFTDNKGNTWALSCYGISRYNASTRNFAYWLKNDFAPESPNLHLHTTYCIDAGNDIWQGNDRNGLVKYNLQQKTVTDYNWLLTAVDATIVYCVYADNNNNIWAGTDNGIIRISNRAAIFKNVSFALQGKELKNMRCRRIIADRNNTIYAATENYGLLKKLKTTSGTDTTIALSTFGAIPVSVLPFQNNSLQLLLNGQYDIGYIYDMWYDQKDIIWLAGFGIARYDTRTDSLEIFLAHGDEKARFESINQFSICFDGRLFWTAGWHNLFTFDSLTRRMQPFRDDKGNMPFENLPCWSLVLKGNWLWAGSANGLYKIHTQTHEVVKLKIHPVLEQGINDISLEDDGGCWISTAGGGVIYYNEHTEKVKQYTNRDGLSNNTVCGLLNDRNNNLWISTYGGLSFFNRQTNQFTNFYAKDGLNTNEFNRKAFFRLQDGRMLFGGLNGYMIFDPAEAFKRDKPVSILFTRFNKINSKGEMAENVFAVEHMKKVTIDPGDKFFSFYFTLSDMYDPAGNRYFYQLQGLDDAWHALGNQHFVSFNGLSPGHYTLKIKGNVGKGSASTNELMVDIVVKRVFYKTTWFILLLIMAAAATVYLIVRYRIEQVKKIQYLRTRIASDLHDDVGSSLVRITILADAIKREGITPGTPEQLGAISGISRGAVSTMKDVVWSIDARNDTMGGMIQYMQEHLHNMLIPAKIDFEMTHTGFSEQEKLAMNFRQNVYLTFKEAINNVVKHAGATRVAVHLKKENNLFTMEIADDGKGIGDPTTTSGQGLYNMQLRAKRLKAVIDIISGQGVTVLLKVPL